MSERMADRRVLACGRRPDATAALAGRLAAAGCRVDEAGDPDAALSAAATAVASGAGFDLLIITGGDLAAGDLAFYRRACVMFGTPRIAMLLLDVDAGAGDAGAGDVGDGAVRLTSPFTDDALAAAVEAALSGAAPERKKRILLVEDNEVNQLVAVGMLNSLGYESEVAADGVEAVAAMEKGAFDLVLMDVRMPVMDGLEATRRIRALGGAAETVPVVAVTANAMRGDEEACLAAGMSDYLAKPIRLTILDATLKRWLQCK